MNRLRRAYADFLLSLETPNAVRSHVIFKRLAKALIRPHVCTGWSKPLLVAHTTFWKSNLAAQYIWFLFNSLRPSQQFFSHVRTGIHALSQYYASDKVSCSLSYQRLRYLSSLKGKYQRNLRWRRCSTGGEARTSNPSIPSQKLYQLSPRAPS